MRIFCVSANDEQLVVQPDLLLNRCQLQDLCTEAAKLKVLGAMEMVPTDRLVRLLNVLEINVRGAYRVSLIADPVRYIDRIIVCTRYYTVYLLTGGE